IQCENIIFAPAKFSLPKCISEAVLAHKTAINSKGLYLNVDVAEEIPKVLMGDQLLIKKILLHLLGNALKFTATGGITISAKILEQHNTSRLIQISILDSGIGINYEDIDEIFNPFHQADNSSTRNFGGVGIGLSICRSLAELMGGSITVKSIRDKGSCFRLTLPFSTI
ncbi:MAG: ATP-binding protein, partial [Deltaproteobacteria bacterium]